MPEKKKYAEYIKDLFTLAMPIIAGNLGIVFISAGDVFVAARYSTEVLAAISIANSILICIFMLGTGILMSVSPLLSNFRGEKDSIKKYFLPTVSFAMILSLVSFLLILGCIPLINKIGFSSTLVPIIKRYMFICSFSMFGAYLHIALKEFLQAFEIVLFPNLLNLAIVIAHLLMDFIFVFGLLGCPSMGAMGLALATLLSRTLIGLIMLLYCLKFIKIRPYNDFSYYIKLLKIGFPVTTAIFLEFSAFYLITILAGRISDTYAAAQSILITLTTATFMIPAAISNAIGVKVGYANGAGNFVDLKRYAYSGVGISIIFMSICALCFLIFPKFFISIFTQDKELIKICIPILMLAGLFQIFDGMQVSLGGVFKGLKKTNILMLGDFGAYWLIGLPLGLLLAFKCKMELYGFWVGLTLAIFSLGIVLLVILLKQFKKLKT